MTAAGSGALALVLDWDGTVTETDTLHLVIAEFGDLAVFRALEEEIGRRLTLREVIACEMETVTAPLDDVLGWLLDTVRIRPGFASLVERHDPLIVSAGFHELIGPVLAREGVQARVVANHVTADPAGWRAVFPLRSRARCAASLASAPASRARPFRLRRRRRQRPVRVARCRRRLRARRAGAVPGLARCPVPAVPGPARRACVAIPRLSSLG